MLKFLNIITALFDIMFFLEYVHGKLRLFRYVV